ncbi:hypothetical protein BHE90_003736 [Fusarium euwallaceae]|uniref:Heterokaryon incompatibility domain-containing protein n=1 Tax=Fusarium euwallaceae TaxID=1147111 RepID=A0A430M198_9HYPO|nr:hypothetical protein BHE90_003736 [Fusarium euwallaceae]
MSRWHEATCVSPDVVLNGDLPTCNTCGAVPDLDAIRLKQQQTSPFPPSPPDEPPGQFNLRWPLGSLYSRATDANTHQGSVNNSNEDVRSVNAFEPSPIYQRRLEPHEFRLLRLDGAASGTDLLHLHLETHDQERFPVYETVSYTWGGENNDNSRSQLVFIGPYWDILLQTQNCWDMLMFLRPADGLRRLWVDAICINQKDDEERSTQVSKMADIYQKAQRALVYLGSSLVDATSPRKYPLRQRFEHSIAQSNESDQLVRNGKVDLDKLLTRRYFSRVWVIQELIVSRQVVFQVGDTEFWADGTSIHKVKDYDWQNTPAPWLVHLAQGTPQGRDIYGAMRETWSSNASDLRDKIFGILALIDDRQEREIFRPDYSLSFFHVYLGALAYSLLGLKRVEILCHAAGLSAPDGQPSWMIDSKIPTWPARFDFQGQAESTFKSWRRVWPEEWVWPPRDDLDTAAIAQQRPFDLIMGQTGLDHKRLGPGTFIFSQFSTQYKSRKGVDVDPGPYTMEEFVNPSLVSIYFQDPDAETLERLKEETWHNGATVDASTGSLKINLTRICGFTAAPSKAYTDGSMTIFGVEGASKVKAWMYLITDMPLDRLVIPGRDHLFLLDQGDEKSFVILILRKLDDSLAFKLIGCCYGLYFRFPPRRWLAAYMVSVPPEDDKVFLPDLRNRLRYDEMANFFVEDEILEKLLRVDAHSLDKHQFKTLAREFLLGASPKLFEAFRKYVHRRYRPVIKGEHVEISVHPAAWRSIRDSARMCFFLDLFPEMRYEEQEDWRNSEPLWRRTTHETYRYKTTVQYGELDYSMIHEEKFLHFRASMASLCTIMWHMMPTEPLAGYRSRCQSEVRFDMPPERIVGEEADMLTCPNWPRSLLEGFAIDGRMYHVCIA